MRRFILAASLILAASAAIAQQAPGTIVLQMDSGRSDVTAAMDNMTARFGTVAGALQYNSAKPEESTIALSLDAGSIAEQPAREAFDAATFPELRIESASVARKGSNGSEGLPTAITVRNITKTIVLQVTFKPMGTNVIAMHAEGTLRSADFKMKGGNIQLVIDAPFNRVTSDQR